MVAIIATGAAVTASSYSAFSATTVSPANSWATGSVVLTDDDANAAQFTATGLKPGSTGSHCITVTSTGSLPSAVKLYATAYTPGGVGAASLASNITLTIAQGTGGSFASCTGFTLGTTIFPAASLDSFASTNTSYASGLTAWSPAGGVTESKTYQFTYTVGAAAPQSSTAIISFTWEAQNS